MFNEALSPYIHQFPVGEVAADVIRSLAATPRIIVTAPPGAGKSTLLPLLLLQSMPEGKILMLEPRRIAARQIAERMASMIGEAVGKTVGYRMRFETKVSATTRIEVLTEGIMTRMLVDDPTLDGVGMVIFDEFHERSLTSDTALALVRESQQIIRPDLLMVIMSATIDASALCQALDAPLIESQGRMHEVTILHLEEADQRNCADITASAIKKAHREEQGDILAFLPGKGEIMRCCELLGESLGSTHIYPLYGLLSSEEQRKAIMPSRPGERKVVLATPIAETSLTIEGVKTVIDSGLCKTLVYDPRNGMSHLETVRISLDMAKQRSGRAGRTTDGTCYRLWSKATELRMDDCRQPEIEQADLSSTLLDIAAWGEDDIMDMPWLTPPPSSHAMQARQLLTNLGALDHNGHITPHGRQLALLPCHPRIAKMLIMAEDNKTKALAADIAALLEEKDILTDDSDADINTRIELLRNARRKKQTGRWKRIADIAEQYRRLAKMQEDNTPPAHYATGCLIASAYPERVAQQTEDGKYKLASGDIVTLSDDDALKTCPLLAVASVASHIFLASPLKKEDIEHMSTWQDNISWDSKQGRAIAISQQRLGSLILATRPIQTPDSQTAITEAICQAAMKEGLSMFDFNDDVLRMQRRIAAVAAWHPDLSIPDISTPPLLSRAAEWLPLYIGKATTTAELKKINLCSVIWGLMSYDQQVTIDRMAPTHIQVPTGSRIRINYRTGAESPILSVRLQECFGLTATPTVDEGRRPVLMELLSPGFKPVQLTQDLASFWQTTYFEVRKELRRRYPKHYWPENPLEAEAVRGVKKNNH